MERGGGIVDDPRGDRGGEEIALGGFDALGKAAVVAQAAG